MTYILVSGVSYVVRTKMSVCMSNCINSELLYQLTDFNTILAWKILCFTSARSKLEHGTHTLRANNAQQSRRMKN
jgi:hypothetical protein